MEKHIKKPSGYYSIIIQNGNIDPIFSSRFFEKVINVIGFKWVSPYYQVYSKAFCDEDKRINNTMINLWKNNQLVFPEFQSKMFDVNLLKDLHCLRLKATAFEFPPYTTVTKLDDGKIKYGGFEVINQSIK